MNTLLQQIKNQGSLFILPMGFLRGTCWFYFTLTEKRVEMYANPTESSEIKIGFLTSRQAILKPPKNVNKSL